MMGKVIFLGLVFIGVGVASMIFLLQGPQNATVAHLMDSLYCGPGEHIGQAFVSRSSSSLRVNGQGVLFYCANDAGARRDVTGSVTVLIGGAFVVPFVIGLLMVIVGANLSVRRKMQGALAGSSPLDTTPFFGGSSGQPIRSGTVITINGKTATQADLPPQAAQVLENLLGGFAGTAMQAAIKGEGSLPDKLEQLKVALDKGLITQAEHDRLRQAILDQFDDKL
jgi:hypothetical protein